MFPSLFHRNDITAVYPTGKTTLFGSPFSSNSTLDDSVIPSLPCVLKEYASKLALLLAHLFRIPNKQVSSFIF